MIHVRQTILVAALSCLIALSGDRPVQACEFEQQQDFKIFQSAEVLMVARVIAYQTVSAENHAVFEFETVRLIMGPAMGRNPPKRWRAEWINSTFGLPETWKPKLVVVGLVAEINRKGEPVIRVLQQGCSTPSIVPASEKKLHEILKAAGISPAPISLKDMPWQ